MKNEKNSVISKQNIKSNDEVNLIAIKNNIDFKRLKFEKFKFDFFNLFNL